MSDTVLGGPLPNKGLSVVNIRLLSALGRTRSPEDTGDADLPWDTCLGT